MFEDGESIKRMVQFPTTSKEKFTWCFDQQKTRWNNMLNTKRNILNEIYVSFIIHW